MHLLHRFADADAADGNPRQVEVGDGPSTLAAQMGKASALHDAEQCLVVSGVGFNAAGQPGMGAPAGIDHIVFGGWIGRTLVKGHGHVSPQGHLDLRGVFRGHVDGAAIPGVAEHHAAVIDFVQVPQAEHLKAAGVGEHRTVPAHELVQSTGCRHDLFAGLQMQVIGVGEHHLSPGAGQLLDADPLDGGQGAHGHESGRLHRSMGCVKAAAAGSGVGAMGADLEAEQGKDPLVSTLR